jgi:hypothetical protein
MARQTLLGYTALLPQAACDESSLQRCSNRGKIDASRRLVPAQGEETLPVSFFQGPWEPESPWPKTVRYGSVFWERARWQRPWPAAG